MKILPYFCILKSTEMIFIKTKKLHGQEYRFNLEEIKSYEGVYENTFQYTRLTFKHDSECVYITLTVMELDEILLQNGLGQIFSITT